MEEHQETSGLPGMTSIVFTCAGAILKRLGTNNNRIWITVLRVLSMQFSPDSFSYRVLLIREELVARVCALGLLRGCCFGCCSGRCSG